MQHARAPLWDVFSARSISKIDPTDTTFSPSTRKGEDGWRQIWPLGLYYWRVSGPARYCRDGIHRAEFWSSLSLVLVCNTPLLMALKEKKTHGHILYWQRHAQVCILVLYWCSGTQFTFQEIVNRAISPFCECNTCDWPATARQPHPMRLAERKVEGIWAFECFVSKGMLESK